MHLNIITPETSWSYGSVTWNPDWTRAYSLRLRLSLRLCHWNIHRCQYWCENYCLFMTLYIEVSFIRWKRHHQHWNYFATAFSRFDSNFMIRLSFSDLIWLSLHVFSFRFKSHNLNQIPVRLQGLPHMPECPENNSKMKSWNIPVFWKLKLVLMRTLYFFEK